MRFAKDWWNWLKNWWSPPQRGFSFTSSEPGVVFKGVDVGPKIDAPESPGLSETSSEPGIVFEVDCSELQPQGKN